MPIDIRRKMLDTQGKWDPALTVLLTSLEESNPSENEITSDELNFLNSMLRSRELNALVKIHSIILTEKESISPMISNSVDILDDIFSDMTIDDEDENPELIELLQLLQNPFLQGILYCHDCIAQKDFTPKLSSDHGDEEESLGDEETIKVVQLVKSNEPLGGAKTSEPIVGATIKRDEESGKIIIARVMHGGAADRSGLIFPNDEVIEVNGIEVGDKTPDDVLQILKQSEGTITFKLIPAECGKLKRESKVRVRCLFSFDPTDDPHIPCTDAGICFTRGDILHIVSQEDIYWWQARHEGDKTMRAGLIPSRALQERRIIMARTKTTNDVNCLEKHESLTKKIDYDVLENEDYDREDIATYEEVVRYYPRPGCYRPIVLIGPPGVGRNELKRRLIDTNSTKYKTTIPYTSRPQRPSEVDGKEYNFVTRAQMEADIQAGKFIEFGEYKGNLYGTSSESILEIIKTSQVPILNPHSQAIKMLRTKEFKPYIVYIKPPKFEVLKESRHRFFAKSTFNDDNCQRAFNDEEFNEILHSSDRIDFLYGHFFDEVILNDDLTKAFAQLLIIANKVENEPLWIPSNWV